MMVMVASLGKYPFEKRKPREFKEEKEGKTKRGFSPKFDQVFLRHNWNMQRSKEATNNPK